MGINSTYCIYKCSQPLQMDHNYTLLYCCTNKGIMNKTTNTQSIHSTELEKKCEVPLCHVLHTVKKIGLDIHISLKAS